MRRGEELQGALLDYISMYGEHFHQNYVYAYFDFSEGPDDVKAAAEAFITQYLKNKDCLGSLNKFKSREQLRLDGLLLLERRLFDEFRNELLHRFDFRGLEECTDDNTTTFRMHDKWGRPHYFFLYD